MNKTTEIFLISKGYILYQISYASFSKLFLNSSCCRQDITLVDTRYTCSLHQYHQKQEAVTIIDVK